NWSATSSWNVSKLACGTQRPKENAWGDRSASWMFAGWQGYAPRALVGRKSRERWGLVSERSIGSLERVPKFRKGLSEPRLNLLNGGLVVTSGKPRACRGRRPAQEQQHNSPHPVGSPLHAFCSVVFVALNVYQLQS